MKTNLIWIEENIDSEEYKKYSKELDSFGNLLIELFKNLDKAIEYMKYIKFQDTKVIVSGKLYPEFVSKFKENIIEMYNAPKIIIFTNDKKKFIENNQNYQNNNTFYHFGGLVDIFEEVKNFLKKEDEIKNVLKNETEFKKVKIILMIFN